MQRTSEEIQAAMHTGDTTKQYGGNGSPTAAKVLADYIRELHDRLTEARREYEDALNGIYFGEAVPAQDRIVLDRIDATLAKLPEGYR